MPTAMGAVVTMTLKQSAIAIDPDGIDPDFATWDEVAGATTLHTFGGLGGELRDAPDVRGAQVVEWARCAH